MKKHTRITQINIGTNMRIAGRDIYVNGSRVIDDSALVSGNGSIKSEKRTLGNFSTVQLQGPVVAQIENGDWDYIEISGEENLLPLISTRVSAGTLSVSIVPNTSFTTNLPIIVKIGRPTIERLSISGSGDATFVGLNQDSLNLEITGSGDIDASGCVKSVNIHVYGSGEIDTTNVASEQVDIHLSGSGDIRARASRSARVRLNGSGDVVIQGSPTTRDVRISGSGDVHFQ